MQYWFFHSQHKSQKECHFTKLNELKVNQKWRDILRKSKSKEFQREIEEMNRCFREVLKQKDVMIEILQREHEEADRQHSIVTRQHFINMDKLIGIDEYIRNKCLYVRSIVVSFI